MGQVPHSLDGALATKFNRQTGHRLMGGTAPELGARRGQRGPVDCDVGGGRAARPSLGGWYGKNGSNRPALHRWRAAGLPAWAGAADRPRFGVISVRFAAIVDETGLSARHSTACGLLHSRSAFGIGLPLTASVRRHLGCGCSSVVEHDLAKVGVEGSSPFARSRFSSMANYRTDDRPPFGGLVVCAPAM